MTESTESTEDVFGGLDAAEKDPKIESRTLIVRRMYKEGKVVTKENGEEEQIEIYVPHSGIPMAEVEFNCRMTVNMGNFESVQLGVGITLPCVLEELDDCFVAAKNMVDVKLNKEVDDLKEYRESKKGS